MNIFLFLIGILSCYSIWNFCMLIGIFPFRYSNTSLFRICAICLKFEWLWETCQRVEFWKGKNSSMYLNANYPNYCFITFSRADIHITSISEFMAYKQTHRHSDPVRRLLCLTETCFLERDPSTYSIGKYSKYKWYFVTTVVCKIV